MAIRNHTRTLTGSSAQASDLLSASGLRCIGHSKVG